MKIYCQLEEREPINITTEKKYCCMSLIEMRMSDTGNPRGEGKASSRVCIFLDIRDSSQGLEVI